MKRMIDPQKYAVMEDVLEVATKLYNHKLSVTTSLGKMFMNVVTTDKQYELPDDHLISKILKSLVHIGPCKFPHSSGTMLSDYQPFDLRAYSAGPSSEGATISYVSGSTSISSVNGSVSGVYLFTSDEVTPL